MTKTVCSWSWPTVVKGLLVARIIQGMGSKKIYIHCIFQNIDYYKIVQEYSILLSKLNSIAHGTLKFISGFRVY